RFLDLVEVDTKKGALAVSSAYYGDIVRLISEPRYLHDVPSLSLPNFLRCANSLLGLQVLARIIQSIEHLLEILNNWRTVPLLKLQLKCEANELFHSPTMEDIFQSFRHTIDHIARVGQTLPPLESWVGVKTDQDRIRVIVPEWYLEEAYQRLEQVLANTFKPMTDYVTELRDKFQMVFDPEARSNIVAYVSTGRSFRECASKVEDFNRFVREINGMLDHEYFSIGSMRQVEAKAGLLRYTKGTRELIIQELVKSHRNFNLEICNTFEEIRERALNVPSTTKELLELGAYMLVAASTTMRSLEEQITASLHMMASLIGMTSLAKDHIELNNTTIHWLKSIRPVFEQNSAMYEATKWELEEKLHKRIEVLNADVRDMFPR
ncbi:dynein axonemal heavy chain 12-like, partial [Andrena cerasifolii]|uniref:dynein axonemal heavy chain 12-like n=1 Tax=Andrena cerasifolii TaxID=2819439 RepID=UPI004038292E